MKKQEQKQIISIDEFDSTVSLYQLLSPGAGRGLSHLKVIVNSLLHNPEQPQAKPLSLLIAGKQGLRTHARSFIRALGLEYIKEIPAQLLHAPPTAIYEFFTPLLLCDSYVISRVDALYPGILKTLFEIISKGEYSKDNYQRQCKEVFAVYKPIMMTTSKESKIPNYFLEQIDHIVKIEDYTDQQLELIVLQRLKYGNIDYQEEKVLWLLKEYGDKKLHNIIRLLKSAITVMLSDSRTVLRIDDIKKVMGYS